MMQILLIILPPFISIVLDEKWNRKRYDVLSTIKMWAVYFWFINMMALIIYMLRTDVSIIASFENNVFLLHYLIVCSFLSIIMPIVYAVIKPFFSIKINKKDNKIGIKNEK